MTRSTVLIAALLASVSIAFAAGPQVVPEVVPDETPALPALPTTPAPITELIAAQAFTVESAWESDWRTERTSVREGWLVVIKAPHAFVVPRQTEEPVLFAGATTVERITSDLEHDLIVAIIPASAQSQAVPGHSANASRSAMRPLSEIAIWFGAPALPEQMDQPAVAAQIALAEGARIAARPKSELERGLARGGAALALKDRAALLIAAEALARANGAAAQE